MDKNFQVGDQVDVFDIAMEIVEKELIDNGRFIRYKFKDLQNGSYYELWNDDWNLIHNNMKLIHYHRKVKNPENSLDFIIIDDPYEEATEDQKEKAKKWIEEALPTRLNHADKLGKTKSL